MPFSLVNVFLVRLEILPLSRRKIRVVDVKTLDLAKKPEVKFRLVALKPSLDLPEFESSSKSPQLAWFQRMKKCVEDQWMAIPSFYLENVGGPFTFYCDYERFKISRSKQHTNILH